MTTFMLDWSDWSTPEAKNPTKFLTQGSEIVDIAYFRGWNGYGDDAKFSENKKLVTGTSTAHGSILGSSFMWLSYDAGNKAGDKQAEAFWATFSAGGQWWALPPAIDAERRRFKANGVWQYVPFPAVASYGDQLHKAVDYLTNKLGRRPVFYSNIDVILNYLYPYITSTAGAWLLECPLWAAHWRASVPFQGYKPNPWPNQLWYMHQKVGDAADWPGIDDVDIGVFNGSRAEAKAWGKDPSWKPGTVVPPEEPPEDPPVTPADPTLGLVLAELIETRSMVGSIYSDVAAIKSKLSAAGKQLE